MCDTGSGHHTPVGCCHRQRTGKPYILPRWHLGGCCPDGRFDSNNLAEIKGLHWIMPDNPLPPLPIEIYMRDYYEPKLLPRLLSGKKDEFKAVRPLQSLNRASRR